MVYNKFTNFKEVCMKKLDFDLVAEYILGNIKKIQQYKDEKRDEYTLQFLIKAEFQRDIRYFTDHAMEWNKRYYSKKAAEKFGSTELTLEKMERKDQTNKNKMNDPGRKIFHDEHMYPVKQLTEELLNLHDVTLENVKSILKKSALAWITKEENKKLDEFTDDETGLSAKSYRTDPFEIYKKIGRELVNL
jgi:disulfide oxidoreductase YuzD